MTYNEAEQKKILMFPTIATLAEVADSIGLNYIEGADRLLMPWDLHRLIFTFSPAHPAAIVALAQVRCEIAMSELSEVTEFLATWNSERISPTASLRITDEGDIAVAFASHYPIGAGASFEQVADFMYRSCDVTEMAMTEMSAALGDHLFALNDVARTYEDDKALRAQLFRHYDIDADPGREIAELTATNFFLDSDEPPALFDEEPAEVTIDTVAEAWRQRGIENMDVRDDFIVTGINNILMAAFLDNGPSLLLRGHWDCDFPISQELKAFLIANDWNAAHPSTRALWVAEEDVLQLRVECAFPITHGLTADQLDLFISAATQGILAAIDALSLEISDSSPVHWPES